MSMVCKLIYIATTCVSTNSSNSNYTNYFYKFDDFFKNYAYMLFSKGYLRNKWFLKIITIPQFIFAVPVYPVSKSPCE